ncbi:YggS family pyridoxal phosphate-dependent enzyme [Flavobacterium sp.]|uniref:YggS family pyridoxal phosphate-dependent enzyme n=1 Tax=Flavobacterium sp. TaxID=239 RepID=UPI0026368E75|nr:YggS family pyridoxal phosphate-dependent enzyme [Flavobacterium sp.]
MSIAENLLAITSELPQHVTLVAVSKTWPVDDIMQAYGTGHRVFGENKIQEMSEKQDAMPKDTQWHMIGHVQTNKVKLMASYVTLIHGVDSLKLLEEIDKQAKKNSRTIDCLLQMHIAAEDTKFGLDESELEALVNNNTFKNLKNVKVTGLMGMATFTNDENQIRKEFTNLKSIFDRFRMVATENCELKTLSMGMSGDYKIAIECGSTMVRIGSSIFGRR